MTSGIKKEDLKKNELAILLYKKWSVRIRALPPPIPVRPAAAAAAAAAAANKHHHLAIGIEKNGIGIEPRYQKNGIGIEPRYRHEPKHFEPAIPFSTTGQRFPKHTQNDDISFEPKMKLTGQTFKQEIEHISHTF